MKDSEKQLLAAGVPKTLWDNDKAVIDFLTKKVIALSEQVGADTEVIDEESLKATEERVYESVMRLNSIDVYAQYNKAYIATLSEKDRVATKAALARFANERNVQLMEYWV